MAYPISITEVQHDKITDRETVKLGFTTTAKTNLWSLTSYVRQCAKNEIELNDKTTIREMLTYIVTETGAMEAEASCFDDCVMSLALANYVHEGAWEPVEVPNELYIEMV